MICVSIAQTSRRFALVDMMNAAPQCDLLEVRLDRFREAPEVGELLAHKPKPVIMSCRRARDGGEWEGTEEERLALLRQCIVSGADYVELDLDVADQVRPFPPSKRVISYTNLTQTPADIAEIYRQAQAKKPDVIKLATLARTPEEAWPLVQLLADPPVPTVVAGLDRPGLMLAVLGRKIGAPWVYAALERGMEAYPGEPTVFDLEHVYAYRDVGRGTRLVGVSGFGERAYFSTAALNGLFRRLGLPARVLPVGVGRPRLFRRIAAAVKMAGVVVDPEHQHALREVAAEADPSARIVGGADLLLHKAGSWHGHNTLPRAAVAALEHVLQPRSPGQGPLHDRLVALVGATPLTRSLAQRVRIAGGGPIIVSRDKDAGHALARELGCRYILFEGIYTTLHDVLIVCDYEEALLGTTGHARIHPGYLKSGMAVMDLTAVARPTPLLVEARSRGCAVVRPRDLLLAQIAVQARYLTRTEITPEHIREALPEPLKEDDEQAWTVKPEEP
jgi:3-dehydroquinate dehydratase/shikimate dehydrogenase